MKLTIKIDAPTLIWLVLILGFSALRQWRVQVTCGCRQPNDEAAYTPGAPTWAPLSLYAHPRMPILDPCRTRSPRGSPGRMARRLIAQVGDQ